MKLGQLTLAEKHWLRVFLGWVLQTFPLWSLLLFSPPSDFHISIFNSSGLSPKPQLHPGGFSNSDWPPFLDLSWKPGDPSWPLQKFTSSCFHNQASIKSKHTERKQIHLTNDNHLSEHNFWALLEKALLYLSQRKEKGRGGRREPSLLHNYLHTLFISEVGVNVFHNDEHTKTTIFSVIDLSQTDFCFW